LVSNSPPNPRQILCVLCGRRRGKRRRRLCRKGPAALDEWLHTVGTQNIENVTPLESRTLARVPSCIEIDAARENDRQAAAARSVVVCVSLNPQSISGCALTL